MDWENKITTLKKKYFSAKPFPHLEIKNFLGPKKAASLLKALQNERFYEKDADLFKFLQTNDLSGTKSKILREFRTFLASQKFIQHIEDITTTKLKKGVIDLHGTWYRDTDFLLCHEDKLEGRKIAFMLYLTDLKKSEGGCLELYAAGNPKKIVKTIPPKANSFVFFEISKKSFHQVSELLVDKQRITIAGWFHG